MLSLSSLKSSTGTPTGTIVFWPGEIKPGYLRCDGRVLNAADYPELAKILGTGSSSRYKKDNVELRENQFQLPDLGSKRILASSSSSSSPYKNIYSENGYPKSGVSIRMIDNNQGTYDLRLSGHFTMPVQAENEFLGSMRVRPENGYFTDMEEVDERMMQPHGHFHSGYRTRVQGDGDPTQRRQNNFKRTLSRLNVVDWQENMFQPACAYDRLGRDTFTNFTFPPGKCINTDGFVLPLPFANRVDIRCRYAHGVNEDYSDNIKLPKEVMRYSVQKRCLMTEPNINSAGSQWSSYSYRLAVVNDPGLHHTRLFSSVTEDKDYERQGTDKNKQKIYNQDAIKLPLHSKFLKPFKPDVFDPFLNNSNLRLPGHVATFGLPHNVAMLMIITSNIGGGGSNRCKRKCFLQDYTGSGDKGQRDRIQSKLNELNLTQNFSKYNSTAMPFDITDASGRSRPGYSSVRNVTVLSSDQSGNTTHRHFMSNQNDQPMYMYDVGRQTKEGEIEEVEINPQGLTCTMQVDTSNVEFKNEYTPSYVVCEHIIKY